MDAKELQKRLNDYAMREKIIMEAKIESLSLEEQKNNLMNNLLEMNSLEVKKLFDYLTELLEQYQRTNKTLTSKLIEQDRELKETNRILKAVTDDLSHENITETQKAIKDLKNDITTLKTAHMSHIEEIRAVYDQENEEIKKISDEQKELFAQEIRKSKKLFSKNNGYIVAQKFGFYAIMIFSITIIALFLGHTIFSLLQIFFNWLRGM